MNLNKKIGFLLDYGFTPKFVSNLNENKINLLFEKMSKEENKEAQEITTKIKRFSASEVADAKTKGESLPGGKAVKMNPDGSVDVTMEGKDLEEEDTLNVVNDPDATADGMGIFEKFESKAQQGLFWARCNKCKTDDCKWCKMAKEFSKSTSKKQYEDMPEKKHPEKTVKYKKKETKENFTFKDYLGKLGSVYTGEMMKKSMGTTPRFNESIFEKNLEKIIENNMNPTITKGELLSLLESITKNNISLHEDFYFGESEMNENQPGVKEPATKPKTPTEKPQEKPRRKPSRETPYENPETRPQGKDDDFDMMDMEFMAEPGVKEPTTKPKTPTEKPKEKPRRKPERITPYENPETRPQGEEEFDFVMEKLYNRLKKK